MNPERDYDRPPIQPGTTQWHRRYDQPGDLRDWYVTRENLPEFLAKAGMQHLYDAAVAKQQPAPGPELLPPDLGPQS